MGEQYDDDDAIFLCLSYTRGCPSPLIPRSHLCPFFSFSTFFSFPLSVLSLQRFINPEYILSACSFLLYPYIHTYLVHIPPAIMTLARNFIGFSALRAASINATPTVGRGFAFSTSSRLGLKESTNSEKHPPPVRHHLWFSFLQ